jgi:hypothetical protein
MAVVRVGRSTVGQRARDEQTRRSEQPGSRGTAGGCDRRRHARAGGCGNLRCRRHEPARGYGCPATRPGLECRDANAERRRDANAERSHDAIAECTDNAAAECSRSAASESGRDVPERDAFTADGRIAADFARQERARCARAAITAR